MQKVSLQQDLMIMSDRYVCSCRSCHLVDKEEILNAESCS